MYLIDWIRIHISPSGKRLGTKNDEPYFGLAATSKAFEARVVPLNLLPSFLGQIESG
jgi:hypothetical protein